MCGEEAKRRESNIKKTTRTYERTSQTERKRLFSFIGIVINVFNTVLLPFVVYIMI